MRNIETTTVWFLFEFWKICLSLKETGERTGFITKVIDSDNPYNIMLHEFGSDVACDYVKKYIRYPQLKSNWKQKILAGWTNWHTPRNLYINRLLDEVKTGYCIILDDDDIFLDNQAVEKIIKAIDNKKNQMIIWKVKFPNIILPRRLPPSVWDIASCGYAFDIDRKSVV